jgi:ectoine hydroxylase-related dioxygenase (phytanoyl-CoA dioxygenase family)
MDAIAEVLAALPPTRTDLDAAKLDLDNEGVACLSNAIPHEDLKEACESAIELAERERADGTALTGPYPNDAPNQRIYGLVHKAPIWGRIATNTTLLQLVHHILGERVSLFAMQVHIVGKGGYMHMHIDQDYIKPSIPFPVIATALLMLDDFTEQNGATKVVPGSHVAQRWPDSDAKERAISVTGKAGTIAVYDGFLWHGTGVNETDQPRHALLASYCRPWLHKYENYSGVLDEKTYEAFSPELKALIGIHDNPMGIGGGLNTPHSGQWFL